MQLYFPILVESFQIIINPPFSFILPRFVIHHWSIARLRIV
jgi:hypothetical protein